MFADKHAGHEAEESLWNGEMTLLEMYEMWSRMTPEQRLSRMKEGLPSKPVNRRRGSGEWIHGAVNDIQDFAAFLGKLWVIVGWVIVIPLAIWNHEAVGRWLIGVFA